MVVDVDRIAELSKLYIPQEKKQAFEKQMNDLVAMADVLSKVSDDNIKDTECFAPLRDDIVQESGISYDSLKCNAPCFEDGCFCVPKTVE